MCMRGRGTRSPLVYASEVTPGEHEPVLAADHLDSQLLDLDTHYHRFRLSFVFVPYCSGNPFLPVAVYRE